MSKNKNIYTIHRHDARTLSEIIPENIIDVTITSPPYFDMKDYGYKEQIGYGQSYKKYLEDLQKVFACVYNCTKEDGTLWVIIDTFRKNGVVMPLPFDFANKISDIGWKLQEIIIWEKDKTVPWTHNGQMRNLFEYILVFSKNIQYNFYIDRIRQYDSLKKWWVKYPERYNPKGKTPEAIWKFPIPLQGSWGNSYIKHFCPLPEDLIAQILRLTTNENDVVLDPFAGSGAVLAKADNMKRRYVGTELNPNYITMFKNYMNLTHKEKRHQYEQEEIIHADQLSFEKLIIKLRILKYAKTLYSKLPQNIQNKIQYIFVDYYKGATIKANCIATALYTIRIEDIKYQEEIEKYINQKTKEAPLSKFGIDSQFIYIDNNQIIKNKCLFTYTKTATHKFSRELNDADNIFNLSKSEIIISPIKVKLNEKDYE